MIPCLANLSFSARRLVTALWMLTTAAGAAELPPQPPPEFITNVAQISLPSATNFPARRLVTARLQGTVLIGGNFGGVAVLDGSPNLRLLPATTAGIPWERGQRIQIQGPCVLDGTNLLLEPRSLIENDGLHSMNEQSAGLWLAAGKQPLRVRYFNRIGERGLEIYMAGPGLPRQRIPVLMLSHAQTNQADGQLVWTPGLTFKCFAGDWSEMPDFNRLPPVTNGVAADFDIQVSGREDYFGLQFDGSLEIPRAGFYTFSCISDDGSLVDIGVPNVSITPDGRVTLPVLPRLAAGELLDGKMDKFCATIDGVVTFVARDNVGLELELSSGRGRATVTLLSQINLDPQWLIGARVSASGICESVFTPEGYRVAGRLTVGSEDNLQVLELPKRVWDLQTVLNASRVGAELLTNNQPGLVRVRGIWDTNMASGWAGIRDGSGEIYLNSGNALPFETFAHVEALGVAGLVETRPVLRCFAARELPAAYDPNELPLLTTIEEVKQMSRGEAKRGYPVKVRGVITFIWPNAGFFLQDATWSVDVRMGTNVTGELPQIGDFWEVEGETLAEFAPDILARHAVRLGPGILPDPVHPNWMQLMDGSMDAQYIEVQGVVLAVDGNALSLMTRSGRIKVQLPENPTAMLEKLQGALVRVRGCVIPGRDVNTQEVKLGEFELRNASVTVDEPAPQDPFALPLKHATDLLLFDSHASPIQRAKIKGLVLQQHDGVTFLMDRSNGVRIITESPAQLHPGDQIEAVGFPDLSGPSPAFNDALVRRLDHHSLPEAMPLPADDLLAGRYDSTRVAIEGTLVSQRLSGSEQIFEMHSGSQPWLARLSLHSEPVSRFALGSILKLTGVYAGQGGDRARGRDIDSFELLLNSPADALVMRSPAWWTARHAFAVVGALLAVLLLAVVWIGALHRQVEDRTSALKSEIEDHKLTELQLEKKTHMLTREIEERLRVEAEVERGHKQLLITSRLAGMAEVATSVLHNVGNVMTSVNVLSASIVDLVRDSKISSVARLGELLGKNRKALDRFVIEDERGRKIPDFVAQLGAHLTEEQSLLLQKVRVLNENIHHINEIVAMQQDYAKASGMLETLPPEDVVEDALRMHGESLKRHGIQLIRDYEQIPPMTLDRHKVLQILFNLFENAKYACIQGGTPDKKITVQLRQTATGFVRLTVSDNGMGIAPENLTRIFGQGFSTRKDGHGFGLHSSVLTAQDMGGSLTAHSAGPGKGAAFLLEIPVAPRRESSPRRN
jgi:signal transduction histidine kinase